MAVNLVITADLTASCGFAEIIDNSIYSAVPDSRQDFGIALFVTKNGTLDYTLSDFTNSDPWYIPITNHTPYMVVAFQVNVWKLANIPYADASVVYHIPTGVFWFNSSGAPTNDVPGTGSDWVQITNDITGYTNFSNACNNYAYIDLEQDCPDYTIKRTICPDPAVCCKIWKFCDNSGNLNSKQVTLYDYNMNQISQVSTLPSMALCFDITLPSQGVYILEVYELTGIPPAITGDPQYLIIYEYCQLEQCVQYLIDQILCTSDPCFDICNPCNPDKITKQQNARTELNRLIALFGTLIAMINAEKIKYLGYFAYDTERSDFVSKIGMYFTKISEIAIRCGICTSGGVTATENAVFQNVISGSLSRDTGCTECN